MVVSAKDTIQVREELGEARRKHPTEAWESFGLGGDRPQHNGTLSEARLSQGMWEDWTYMCFSSLLTPTNTYE